MKKIKDTLPNKMSELLKLAMKDLAKVEKQKKKYDIYMHDWYIPKDEFYKEKCQVCLAGSVLATTCKLGDSANFNFENNSNGLPQSLERKLVAINALRVGEVQEAFGILNPLLNLEGLDRNIIDYQTSKKLFKKEINQLIKDLEKVNL